MEIRQIPIGMLDHHPDNPRQDLGDLSELTESIKHQGLMQNLTVVPDEKSGKYLVVIGNRRLEASRAAGLAALPCVISDMDEKQQMATMLAENMQRQDLTLWEQAHGFQMMMDLGFTPKEIGDRTGFSETTVNRRLKLGKYRKKEFEAACRRGATLMDFAELEKIEKAEDRYQVMAAAGTENFRAEFNRVYRIQEMDKNKAKATRLMKEAGIKELPNSERFSTTWDRVTSIEADQEDRKILEDVKKTVKEGEEYRYYFYSYAGRCGAIEIRKKVIKNTGLTEREKEQRAQSRKLNAHVRKVQSVYKQTYALRKEFVQGFRCRNAQEKARFLEVIAETVMVTKNSWDQKLVRDHQWKDDMIREMLGLEDTAKQTIQEAAGGIPAERLLLAWMLCGGIVTDEPERGWFDPYDGNWTLKAWQSRDTDRVYNMLEKLGYTLSDMEKRLRDGTHECYKWED